jgi:hypothetical protein
MLYIISHCIYLLYLFTYFTFYAFYLFYLFIIIFIIRNFVHIHICTFLILICNILNVIFTAQ